MFAPAKINLDLAIIGKRADGYHLLQSLLMFADVGDEVNITPSDALRLDVQGTFATKLPKDNSENLIIKAAKLLLFSCSPMMGELKGAHITLNKQLPIGAGLGGGSSDAAAALKQLAAMWNCSIPHNIPEQLGSDVAACLMQTPLWMEDTGNKIHAVSIPFDISALLVNPRVEVPTKLVYQSFDEPFASPKVLPQSFENFEALIKFLRTSSNMLQKSAQKIAPTIVEVIAAIMASNACELARMSGSGSTCFGLYSTKEQANEAAKMLAKEHPSWWIMPTTLRGSHGKT